MKYWFAVLVAACGLTPGSTMAAGNPQVLVRAAFVRYDEGWRTYNVDRILAAMAPDFEWVNSVGLRIGDRKKLGAFLAHLFAEENFRTGVPGPLVIHSIKLLSPDVAVVSSSEVTDGQKVWDTGKTVPHQHTNELTVMQRFDGHWLIVSDLSSDEANGI